MTKVVEHPVARGSWRSMKDGVEHLRDCRTSIIGVELREVDVEGKGVKDDMKVAVGSGASKRSGAQKKMTLRLK